MKLHVVLYVLGTLILLGAWIAQQRYEELKSQVVKDDVSNSEDRVVARVTEATNPEGQINSFRDELVKRGARTTRPQLAQKLDDEPEIEKQIQAAIKKLPAEIRVEQQDHFNGLLEESKAQQFAEEVDREFRPRVNAVIDLVYDVVKKSGKAGLIDLRNNPTKLILPEQIVYTTFAMKENNIFEEQLSNAMVFQFGNGADWKVYLKLGMVQSPKSLVASWDAPTNKYFPMLRLIEKSQGREYALATIWFHQDSKDLGFVLNDRHVVKPATISAIDELEKTRQGNDQVSASLIELLKNLRVVTKTNSLKQ